MTTVAIIGMGLIGTSLGMALRNAEDSRLGSLTVVGYDRDRRSLGAARGRLAIDREARDLADAVRGAQVVVLAVPVLAARDLLREIAPLLAAGTLVTDVCSTKAAIMGWATESLPAGVDFIGGHPMAGSERTGPEAADAALLLGAIYCLCVPASARKESVDLAEALVVASGAKPYYIDPAEHDSYMAAVSHLPFVLSAALVDAASRSSAWREMQPLAATGFRDVTRLASGSAEMHRDICMTNRPALSHWLGQVSAVLDELRAQLAAGDEQAVAAFFAQAHEQREAWLQVRPNMRPGEEAFEGQQPPPRVGLFGRLSERK